jgi:hypothetical protein
VDRGGREVINDARIPRPRLARLFLYGAADAGDSGKATAVTPADAFAGIRLVKVRA